MRRPRPNCPWSFATSRNDLQHDRRMFRRVSDRSERARFWWTGVMANRDPGRREFLQVAGLGLASLKLLGGCAPPLGAIGEDNWAEITVDGMYRVIRSNGVPDHPTGDFPNRHCPSPIRSQSK